MSIYQYLTVTSYPPYQTTIYETLMILKSSNCIVNNNRKHLLSSNIEDYQLMTLCHWKISSILKPNCLNLEFDNS